jgi:16S rRNA (guanine966-N2)-methyltransferase
MRITGGQRKGRILASPKGLETRPTSDQVREAIFNIIGQDLRGVKVLDLFAGTGSLGLETLSRGASCAVFIDNSRQSVKLIKKNLALCGYEDAGVVLRRDLRKGIRRIQPVVKGVFDLVFIDPPYGKDFISLILSELSTTAILSDKSRVVAESSKSEKLPFFVGMLEMIDGRSYGYTKVSFYAYEAEK